MIWVYYLLLLGISLVGVLLTVAGLPGIWLMVVCVLAYVWWVGVVPAGWWLVVMLLGLGVLGELLESALGGVAAGRMGGSKRGMVGAIVGGLVGAVAGTPLIPIPVVGTIIGACVGSFVGAFGVELFWIKRTTEDSLKIGAGAAAGKLAGIVVKVAVGGVMFVATALWTFPLFSTGPVPPPVLAAPIPVIAPLPPPTTVPTPLGEVDVASPSVSTRPTTFPATQPAP